MFWLSCSSSHITSADAFDWMCVSSPSARWYSWNESAFRCLHVCFIQRSSKEARGEMSRLQPGEKPEWLKRLDRVGIGWLFSGVIGNVRSPWKDSKYRRGELQSVDVEMFFPEGRSASCSFLE